MTNALDTNSFLNELNNSYFDDDDCDNMCHISFKPFDGNAISLPCKHKFNYVPLYNYIVSIKKKFNRYSTLRLGQHDIICPLCRNVSYELLPFVPHGDVTKRVSYVTGPGKYCMAHRKCCSILKNGKNRGFPCGRSGYHTKHGDVCVKHDIILKSTLKHKRQQSVVDKKPHAGCSNPAIAAAWEKYTVISLKKVLRDNKLTMTGNKKVLIQRILDNNIEI